MLTYRQNTIYGPQREVTRENCKYICTKDSVRDALHKGEYGGDANVWLTSAKESYQGEPKENNDELRKQSRHSTSFVLGFDKCAYLTTTQDYKKHEILEDKLHKEKQSFDMDKSHIPDFCPEYLESRETEPSEYQVSFTLESDKPVSISKTSEDRRKHTNDLRATHFQLGSCSEPKKSETTHSFCEVTKKEQQKMIGASERSKSTVFRSGDWNSNDRKMLPKSVTGKDFIEPTTSEAKYEVDKEVPSTLDHRSTHFKLGNDGINDSIYSKDFMMSPNLATCKPSLASEPKPAMVIPNDTDPSFESTLQSNFGNCGRDVMLKLKQERKKNCAENKSRQTENSVPISFKKETSQIVPQNLMSMTKCHFPLQPSMNMVPYNRETGFTDPYNHLTSDCNGEETKLSETKASYITAPIASKELREQCYRQFKDNKSTHFVFGNDNLNDVVTEQGSQYRQHLPVDPSLRAAGKSLPQKKIFHHMNGTGGQFNSGGKQTDSNIDIQSTSVMRRDYKPIHKQPVADRIPSKTVETHFFHMDNDFQGTRNSTTRTDFLPPPEII